VILAISHLLSKVAPTRIRLSHSQGRVRFCCSITNQSINQSIKQHLSHSHSTHLLLATAKRDSSSCSRSTTLRCEELCPSAGLGGLEARPRHGMMRFKEEDIVGSRVVAVVVAVVVVLEGKQALLCFLLRCWWCRWLMAKPRASTRSIRSDAGK
jgi:hypothetical protein